MSDQKYPKPPSHRTFTFGPIIIDSDFDSGNCSHVQKISQCNYQIWIGTDNPKNNYRTWFYFSVVGFNQGTCVSFKIKNMQNQSKLLSEGLVPVYRQQNSNEWKRIRQKINLSSIEYYEGWIQWTFKHTFTSNQKVYIAFFYPWSNEDNNNFLSSIEQKVKSINNIYYYRSAIIKSLQGRNLQFIVISSNSHKSNRQQKIEDKLLFQGVKKPHIFNQNKKGIVISARVHPGQLPGSHVMTGIIQQLTQDNEKAKLLRDNFVFYIFPILNPDGVARGHYRVDTNGINLNRCYINPTPKAQPTIYAIRNWIMHLNNNHRFFAFLDLHAHASRRGTFIYGNSINELSKQVQTCLFPKILSMNSADFQYEGSNFTQQNMYCKDKGDHMSKEGSGRVAIYKATKNPFCWTLQCNYNMSRLNNILESRRSQNSKLVISNQNQLNAKIITAYRILPQKQSTQFFNLNTFYKLGRQICQSFLDLIQKNPQSRIDNPNSYFQSVQNLKMNLTIALLRMAPTRFEPQFKKIYTSLNSQAPQIINRSLQALYYLIIKNGKISNITNFIKDGDLTTLTFQSPKKAKSASVVQQPKFSSLLQKSSLRVSKPSIDHEWKSVKFIEKSNIDIIDFRLAKRQSLNINIEADIRQNQSGIFQSPEDRLENAICQKLKLYQNQMKSHRTTSLKLQTPKIFALNSIQQQIKTKQHTLSPVKLTKIRFKQTQLPSLRNKLKIEYKDSPHKGKIRSDFVKDPLLFIQADWIKQ